MTQPTIKEKMEKLITDETFNPEPCNIRLFATNIARIICEEMTGEKMLETSGNTKSFDEGYNARVTEEKQKAQEIFKDLE